jgi:predicted dehydrogenase
VPFLKFLSYGLNFSFLVGYTLNVIRYLSSSDPISVLSASHQLHIPRSSPSDFVPNVDRATAATLSLPNDIVATLNCDLGTPHYLGFIPHMPKIGVVVECEGGEIKMFNFVAPTYYHWITVHTRDGTKQNSRTEKVYKFVDAGVDAKGEEWWTTYRYQLEAFVDRLKGRTPQAWIDEKDSVANMEWIEKIYSKVCHLVFFGD